MTQPQQLLGEVAAPAAGLHMVVFHHIPRTAGTFLNRKLRNSSLLGGPLVHLATPMKWVPDIYLDRTYRPRMLTYHTSAAEFARVYQRRPGDFTFTFLRDRVDMVYSNYAYMKRRVDRGDQLEPWAAGAHDYFQRSLEEHVDTVLQREAPDAEYPTDLALYDFVGISEEMDRSLAALDRVLGTTLVNDERINCVPVEKTYRRRDLEAFYAPQLALHAQARARLLQLG